MTTARLTTSTYLGTLACTAGFLFACYFPSPRAKLAISAPTLLGIIAVMVGRRQVVEDDRTASDIRAIQHQAMQSNLWHSLTAKPVNVSMGEARLEQREEYPALPASIDFPVEDLALRMAETTTDPSNGGSILIACPKRTGKSNLLRAAIAATARLHGGQVEFLVFDGKGGESFCGLEETANYFYSGDIEAIPQTYNKLTSLKPRLRSATGFPTVPVLDEYNNILAAAKLYDKLNSKENGFKTAELLSASTYERITKGGSKLVCDWITSHQADVQAIDLSLSLQQSLNYIVLGRGSLLGAINAAVSGQRPIIDDDLIRERLKTQFQQWRQQNGADPSRVIALTNIGGDWRLVILPRYPDHQQPVRSLLSDDKPTTALPESDAEEYDPDLADWQLYQSNGGTLRGFAFAKGKAYTGGAIANRVQELRRKFG